MDLLGNVLSRIKGFSNDAKFIIGLFALIAQAVFLYLFLPEPLSAYIAFPIAVVFGFYISRNFR